MKEQLYIPKKINVGFQKREGTYTGKLAYVIYWDDKGKLRKEASWNSWRHKPEDAVGSYYSEETERYERSEEKLGDFVKAQAIENEPTEGFVLNKGVGGQRQSWGWNARNEYIRVYDPRDFEFEISVANLLFILQETSSLKGKGLEGKFVYSWDGKDLVLLPVGSYEYEKSSQFSALQSKKVTKADMFEGCQYVDKNGRNLIYLGRQEYMKFEYRTAQKKKLHVFYDIDHDSTYSDSRYIPYTGFVNLRERTTTEAVYNYADLLEEYMNSRFGTCISKIKEEELDIDWEALKVADKSDYGSYPQKNVYVRSGNTLYKAHIQFCEARNGSWYERKQKVDHFEIRFNYVLGSKESGISVDYCRRGTLYLTEDEAKRMFEYKDVKFALESGSELTYEEYFDTNY